jgi:plastocyanin
MPIVFARLCLSLCLALAALPMAAVGTVAAAPVNFTVQAGAVPGGPPTGWDVWATLFEPSSLTIDAGDSVTWTSTADHTVTFGTLPPGVPNRQPVGGTSYSGSGTVSSGHLPAGQRFTLTFPRAGTYAYRCLLHPASMKGTIVVQPTGSPYPVAPGSYQPASIPAFATALAAGQAAIPQQRASHSVNADGTTTWKLAAGFGDGKRYTVERFGASNLTIHTGDTVIWSQNDPNEVHTVSFLSGGPDVPLTLPDGAPNKRAQAPAGGTVYAGRGFVSSGFLKPGQSYALTFSRAGSFRYQCLIHDDFGMVATLTVVGAAAPAQLPSTMPSTGGGGGSALWAGLLLCGLLAVAMGLAKLATRRA